MTEAADRKNGAEPEPLADDLLAATLDDIATSIPQLQPDQETLRVRRNALHSLIAEVTALREQIIATQSAADDARADSASKSVQLNQSEELCKQMLSSRSWRITAPLRALSSVRIALARAIARQDRSGVGSSSDSPSKPAAAYQLPPQPTLVELQVSASNRVGADEQDDCHQPGSTLLCISHVLPHQPRSGNEYRINRLLSWLRDHGFNVTLIVCPLPSDYVSDATVGAAAAEFPQLIVVGRDGSLRHNLADDSPIIAKLRDRRVRQDLAQSIGEDDSSAQNAQSARFMAHYCPDVLVEVVAAVDAAIDVDVVLAEYVFMTRPFPILRQTSLKLVDTHDVFSTVAEKTNTRDVDHMDRLDARSESSMLERADVIVGIQPEESVLLKKLVPRRTVVTVGVDFHVPESVALPTGEHAVLLVASYNPMNSKGFRGFLRHAWPLVRRDVADSRLVVVGDVEKAAFIVPDGVEFRGRVDDLAPVYQEATVVINPAVGGTGLKIKTVEALAHMRPVVAFATGIEGLSSQAMPLLRVATSWTDFASGVSELLTAPMSMGDLESVRLALARELGAEAVYSPLSQVFEERVHSARNSSNRG